jgi:hypothetical protein
VPARAPPKREIPVGGLAFSPRDGRFLVVAWADGVVNLWDADTGQAVRSFGQHHFNWGVAFSPAQPLLAVGGADAHTGRGEVQLWNWQTGTLVRTLADHSGIVLSVAFSPDGQRLASAEGMGDNLVHLWATASGEELLQLRGHAGSVFAVVFSPKGDSLATGGADGVVRQWLSAPAGDK